ncbi:MAG: hypothetical protein EXR73_00435 [Myxococcales bacterium]|nr:hypothetical protein [Myxococcales bacterium]
MLLPIVALCSYTFLRSSAVLTDPAGVQYAAEAQSAMDKLDRNLFERYGDVQAFAFHPAARGTAEQITAVANFYCKAYAIYDLLAVVDLDSKVLGCNTHAFDGRELPTAGVVGADLSTERWFTKIKSGRVQAGQT